SAFTAGLGYSQDHVPGLPNGGVTGGANPAEDITGNHIQQSGTSANVLVEVSATAAANHARKKVSISEEALLDHFLQLVREGCEAVLQGGMDVEGSDLFGQEDFDIDANAGNLLGEVEDLDEVPDLDLDEDDEVLSSEETSEEEEDSDLDKDPEVDKRILAARRARRAKKRQERLAAKRAAKSKVQNVEVEVKTFLKTGQKNSTSKTHLLDGGSQQAMEEEIYIDPMEGGNASTGLKKQPLKKKQSFLDGRTLFTILSEAETDLLTAYGLFDWSQFGFGTFSEFLKKHAQRLLQSLPVALGSEPRISGEMAETARAFLRNAVVKSRELGDENVSSNMSSKDKNTASSTTRTKMFRNLRKQATQLLFSLYGFQRNAFESTAVDIASAVDQCFVGDRLASEFDEEAKTSSSTTLKVLPDDNLAVALADYATSKDTMAQSGQGMAFESSGGATGSAHVAKMEEQLSRDIRRAVWDVPLLVDVETHAFCPLWAERFAPVFGSFAEFLERDKKSSLLGASLSKSGSRAYHESGGSTSVGDHESALPPLLHLSRGKVVRILTSGEATAAAFSAAMSKLDLRRACAIVLTRLTIDREHFPMEQFQELSKKAFEQAVSGHLPTDGDGSKNLDLHSTSTNASTTSLPEFLVLEATRTLANTDAQQLLSSPVLDVFGKAY
ncbi:unnamed protein product, partial [Amoebophrya sp. A25]